MYFYYYTMHLSIYIIYIRYYILSIKKKIENPDENPDVMKLHLYRENKFKLSQRFLSHWVTLQLYNIQLVQDLNPNFSLQCQTFRKKCEEGLPKGMLQMGFFIIIWHEH